MLIILYTHDGYYKKSFNFTVGTYLPYLFWNKTNLLS